MIELSVNSEYSGTFALCGSENKLLSHCPRTVNNFWQPKDLNYVKFFVFLLVFQFIPNIRPRVKNSIDHIIKNRVENRVR